MLITLSRRTAICQSVAEVQLTGVAPLGAVSHRFNFFNNNNNNNNNNNSACVIAKEQIPNLIFKWIRTELGCTKNRKINGVTTRFKIN